MRFESIQKDLFWVFLLVGENWIPKDWADFTTPNSFRRPAQRLASPLDSIVTDLFITFDSDEDL